MGRRRLPPPLLRRAEDGRWSVELGSEERDLLARLARELEGILADEPDDPALRRLFPPAHPDDIATEAEYQMLLGESLRSARVSALDGLASTAAETTLDDEGVERWVQGLNAIRLVLGDRLELRDDEDLDVGPDDPRAPHLALYEWLTWLLGRAVDDLSAGYGL